MPRVTKQSLTHQSLISHQLTDRIAQNLRSVTAAKKCPASQFR